MLEPLRAWLNGAKDYYTGLGLYEQLGTNDALKQIMSKGPTDFTRRRLLEELMTIYKQLKSNSDDNNLHSDSSNRNSDSDSSRADSKIQPKQWSGGKSGGDLRIANPQQTEPVNLELYAAASLQANKLYKETMNKRAVLFAMADIGDATDPNRADLVEARAKLALEVVTGYCAASEAFDQANYVKVHGRLADQNEDDEKSEYDHLSDSLVKQTLDNLRKNYNKMKKREQTPERVALLQKHAANIEKLSKRWHSLQLVRSV